MKKNKKLQKNITLKKLESFVMPIKYKNSEDAEKYIQTLRQDRDFIEPLKTIDKIK